MEFMDLINFGKGFVESYVEKAIELARVAEGQYHKAVETYNFVSELVPFPLPRLGKEDEPYEPYEPPPAPAFHGPARVPAIDETDKGTTKASANKAAPSLKVVASEDKAPVKKAAEKATRPKAVKPATKHAATKKPAGKKPATRKPATKKAEAKAVPKEKATPKPKSGEKTAAKPAAKPATASLTRSQLRKYKKADMQKLCREHNISYKQTDTNAVLVERILEQQSQGPAHK